jgi:alkylation response protein AidB-like acyl-CoA dehydrogenase
MNFELDKDQKAYQKAAREFALGEFGPGSKVGTDLARSLDKEHKFLPLDIYQRAAENGFIAPYIPESYRGGGLGVFETGLIIEAFHRVDPTIASSLMLRPFSSKLILRLGNDAQKNVYLPLVANGELLVSVALTEEAHGCDITSVGTTADIISEDECLKANITATRQGDHYILNGEKRFITNGAETHIPVVYLVLCQTDSVAGKDGMSLIVVDDDMKYTSLANQTAVFQKSPKFRVKEFADGDKMGLRSTSSAELVFKDLMVPKSNLLGEENKGLYHILDDFFPESKIELAFACVGIIQGLLDKAIAYAKGREQFGQPIYKFQNVSFGIVDRIDVPLHAARLLTYKAAWEFDHKKKNHANASRAKLYASEHAYTAAIQCLKVFAGSGLFAESDVERWFRDAFVFSVLEGTDAMQKLAIARELFQ